VAYKVCGKLRQANVRRHRLEATKAQRDGGPSPIPNSKWDEALAVVQDEVAKLPEPQRVAFVLCCLEGHGQVQAAKLLGWKLGTLSGRLTRAKDTLMHRLEERGVLLSLAGFLAGLAMTTAPTALVAKASLLCVAIPGTILPLTYGVIAMTMNQVKLLLVGVGLTTGLGVVGLSQNTGTTADAQMKPAEVNAAALQRADALQRAKTQLKEELTAAERQFAAAVARAEMAAQVAEQQKATMNALAKQYEGEKAAASQATDGDYEFIPTRSITVIDFQGYLKTREAQGYQFIGEVNLLNEDKKAFAYWAFHKVELKMPLRGSSTIMPALNMPIIMTKLDTESTVLRAKLEKVTAELAELKKAKLAEESFSRVYKIPRVLDGEMVERIEMVDAMGAKKYPNNFKLNVHQSGKHMTLFGSAAAIEWAGILLDRLLAK